MTRRKRRNFPSTTTENGTYFLKDDGRMLTEAAEFVPDANGALSLKK